MLLNLGLLIEIGIACFRGGGLLLAIRVPLYLL